MPSIVLDKESAEKIIAGNCLQLVKPWLPYHSKMILRYEDPGSEEYYHMYAGGMPAFARRIKLKVTDSDQKRISKLTEDDIRRQGFDTLDDFVKHWNGLVFSKRHYRWASYPYADVQVINFVVVEVRNV